MQLHTDPSSHLNEKVVLLGVAQNAKSGAIVLLSDETPIYINNLEYWNKEWGKKRIRVTGFLRKQKLAPDPDTNSDMYTAGMSGMALVLETATWELVGQD